MRSHVGQHVHVPSQRSSISAATRSTYVAQAQGQWPTTTWFHSVFPTVVQFCLMPEGTILMVIEHSAMKYE